eukprot:scaffold36265_cov26-Tisochrysis_lutea.AAC.2
MKLKLPTFLFTGTAYCRQDLTHSPLPAKGGVFSLPRRARRARGSGRSQLLRPLSAQGCGAAAHDGLL